MIFKGKFTDLLKWVFVFLIAGNCYASNVAEIQSGTLKTATHFTTWQGIEPDKWATAWLIKRYVAKEAYFVLIPPNSAPSVEAIAFGIPEASIRRGKKQAMFHRLKSAMAFNNDALDHIDLIINDMEVKIWEPSSHPYTPWIETLYRQLQSRYHRDQVPVDCYLAFFDGVAELVVQPDLKAETFSHKLGLQTQCPGLADTHATKEKKAFVQQINHLELLREISLGKKIVFVDTREEEEYTEVHLPNAKLLRLRDVDKGSVSAFKDADLVVPYCVKDFRGFEVARAMKELGVQQVATLSPNGLKGWLKAKLPVTKIGDQDESQAMEQLMVCSMEPASCLGRDI